MQCKLCGYGLSGDCEYDVSNVYVRSCVCTQAANCAGSEGEQMQWSRKSGGERTSETWFDKGSVEFVRVFVGR